MRKAVIVDLVLMVKPAAARACVTWTSAKFYRNVYMKQEDILRGTCLSEDTEVNKGLVAGLIVGGLSCIVAVTCFYIYYRRQDAKQKEGLDFMNEDTDEGDGSMVRSKDEAEQEKTPPEADESDMEHSSESEDGTKNDNYTEESDNEQPEQLKSDPEQVTPARAVPAPARFSRPFVFDTDSETSDSEA